MKSILALAVMVLANSAQAQELDWKSITTSHYVIQYTAVDEGFVKEAYQSMFEKGFSCAEKFFGSSFKASFTIRIHPDRNSLDRQWQKDWQMPDFKSECWMVASGTATQFDIISPERWKTEACEHDYSDRDKTQKLITHEVVHVFHGQANASPDFANAEGIDWFVEGLATYASGQCDEKRVSEVKAAIQAGTAPTILDNFWKGKMRYGISGSMVMYIDKTYGREKLKNLLAYSNKKDILNELGLSEVELIEAWKKFW